MSFRSFWLFWGATVLMGIDLLMLRLAASRSYRQRSMVGGRNPLGALAMFPAGAFATIVVVGTDANPFPWVAIIFFVPLFGFSEYRRRQLSALPGPALAPAIRQWRDETPTLLELIRHPLRSTGTNFRYLGTLQATRKADKQWERDQGLR